MLSTVMHARPRNPSKKLEFRGLANLKEEDLRLLNILTHRALFRWGPLRETQNVVNQAGLR
jgi:hypothetical protein